MTTRRALVAAVVVFTAAAAIAAAISSFGAARPPAAPRAAPGGGPVHDLQDAAPGGPDVGPASAAPNVLLLVLDTVRADRCSFLGYDRPTTPSLEEFARESIVFEDAWAPVALSLPAHAALFTGLPPWDLGLVDTVANGLPPSAPTLAALAARRGRATACFTANPWIAEGTGLVRGFDLVVGTYRRSADPPASLGHDLALAWMRSQLTAGRRFLAVVNDMDAHHPRRPPDAMRRAFVSPDLPARAVAEAAALRIETIVAMRAGTVPLADDVRRANADLYDAEIAGLDREVGVLLDAMRKDGMLDDTLVVVAGDHGEGLGEHDAWLAHGLSLRREQLRVPLLVRLPRGVRGGERVRDVVLLEDVFATVAEALGAEIPPGTRGESLLRAAPGRVALGADRSWDDLLVGYPETRDLLRRPRASVYDGRFHLIDDGRDRPVLHDVASDPDETRDVAPEHPDVVERLRALLPR